MSHGPPNCDPDQNPNDAPEKHRHWNGYLLLHVPNWQSVGHRVMNVRVGVGTSVVVGGITDVVSGIDHVADLERVPVGLRVVDEDGDSVPLRWELRDRDRESCWDSVRVRDRDGVTDNDSDTLRDTEVDCDPVRVSSVVWLSLLLRDCVSVKLGDALRDRDVVPLSDTVADPLTDPVNDDVRAYVKLLDTERERDNVRSPVSDREVVRLGLMEIEGVRSADGDFDAVREALSLCVGELVLPVGDMS